MAGRLTEDPSITVLVVEAGYDNRTDSLVYDVYRAQEVYGTDVDWAYSTTQNKTIDA